MTTIYKNAKLNRGPKDGGLYDILVEDGKIAAIGKFDGDGIDLKGKKVRAGLIDIHTHGCVDHDTMDGDGLVEMSRHQAKCGITSFCPTTMTMGMDLIESVINAEIPENIGANILGFHMEGPYISKAKKGAQNEKYIIRPEYKDFAKLKNVRLITIAPEIDGAMEFIRECSQKSDCVICIGHTVADYDCTMEAIHNGANCLTHTFNAMTPFVHTAPGVIGAAIDEHIYAQVISDGLHMRRSSVYMLYKTFGADRMVLISDSLRASGLGDGVFEFGGQMIKVENNEARLFDGTIAGSTSNLMMCVKKAIEFGIPEDDAFRMASQTPAEMLNIKKGKIQVGYDADFIVLDELNVEMTVIGGKVFE